MRPLILVALTLGCVRMSPPTELRVCVSTCGMLTADFDCAEFANTEALAVMAYASHVGWNLGAACNSLAGWIVLAHAGDEKCGAGGWGVEFSDGEKGCIGGLTHRDPQVIEIAPVSPLRESSIAHEMGHVISLALDGRTGHCGWEARGLRAAIREVTGQAQEFRAEEQETGDCE